MNKTPEYTLRAIKAYKARQNQDPVKREQNKIKHREYMRQWRLKKKMEVRQDELTKSEGFGNSK